MFSEITCCKRAGIRHGETPGSKCRLNVHVMSLLSLGGDSRLFKMPLETAAHGDATGSFPFDRLQSGRLSSFGFSGTIAHGFFGCGREDVSSADVARWPSFCCHASLFCHSHASINESSLAFVKLVHFLTKAHHIHLECFNGHDH